MKSIFNPRTGVLVIMIISAGAWRLLASGAHFFLSEYTPIGAMALFGGCYFSDKWKAYLVPLLTLWLTDIVLNYTLYTHELTLFYPGFAWTYGSFALMVLLGTFMRKVNIQNVLLMGISAALIHWVVSDIGVWMGGTLYSKNAAGFVECYVAAIPFLKNMVMSNIIFGGIMFGAFEWAKYKFPALEVSKA